MMLFFSDLAKICKKLKRELELISEEKWQLQNHTLIPFPEIERVPMKHIAEIYAQCCVIFCVRQKILPDLQSKIIANFLDLFWQRMEMCSKKKTLEIRRELASLIEEALNHGKLRRNSMLSETVFLEKIYTEFIRYYNKNQQKLHGIVYTPDYIINFMMRLLHTKIQQHFDLPRGLSSPELILYDPAIGSLSFELGIHNIVKNPDWIKTQFPIQFYGNELNYAAYFIGRFLLADSMNFSSKEKEISLQISFQSALTPEFYETIEKLPHTRTKPIIIFGNPPYAVSSTNKDAWIYQLMTAYAVKEPNLTRLYDDYVKFIRYGQWILEKQAQGILVFITNRKYLDGKVFYGMRQSLLKSMSDIYIIDLFGDARNIKGVSTGTNVFGIQTGVAISLFFKKKNLDQKTATLHYLGIRNGEEELKEVLAHEIQNLGFVELTPQAPKFLFVPITVEPKYQQIWDIHCISLPKCFIKTSRAMISSRDRFMIHVDSDPLKENITLLEKRDYITLRKQGRIKQNIDALFENEQVLSHFDFKEMKRSITAVNYRPFDLRHTIFYTINRRCGKSIILDHLNQSPLIIEEILKGKENRNLKNSNLAFNFVQSMQKPPFTHILCTQGIVDSGIFGYSTSKVAPIWIDGNLNLSEIYISKLKYVYPSITENQLIGYLYGILNSTTLASIFEPMLFHEFPRVFISDKAEFIQKIADLGFELILLHTYNFSRFQQHKYEDFYKSWKESLSHDIQLKSWRFEKNSICFTSFQNKAQKSGKTYYNIPCSAKVWNFRIGSIQIVDHWLKARKFSSLQRGLTPPDWHQFFLMVFIIQETLLLKKLIDMELQKNPITMGFASKMN
ncbi:hypothetical protein NEF87_002383 [Candidatus Lokiarchaeum ossiferum]|uniref:site-specific DNA-methyltransferase (adenine-specific) n=1 Tax=Candidatus Lokiarchaeum ossiferum TaxID=2951803 RepID=A0ABY6HRX2_9ARCH|nr:hypothetical protein NEF87_002383 [Candidatus Lokiarchaeum sp. B-35]